MPSVDHIQLFGPEALVKEAHGGRRINQLEDQGTPRISGADVSRG
jgi:hypothetical protein